MPLMKLNQAGRAHSSELGSVRTPRPRPQRRYRKQALAGLGLTPEQEFERIKRIIGEYDLAVQRVPELEMLLSEAKSAAVSSWGIANQLLEGDWEVPASSKEAYARYNHMAMFARAMDKYAYKYGKLLEATKNQIAGSGEAYAQAQAHMKGALHTTVEGLGVFPLVPVLALAAVVVIATTAYYGISYLKNEVERTALLETAERMAKDKDKSGLDKLVSKLKSHWPEVVVNEVAAAVAEGDTAFLRKLIKASKKPLGIAAGAASVGTALLVGLGLFLFLRPRRKGDS